MLKRSIKWTLMIVIIFALAIFSAIYFSLDGRPIVNQIHQLNSQAADQSKRSLSRAIQVFKNPQNKQPILFTQSEVNGLSALLHRAVPQVSSVINLSRHRMKIAASIELSQFLPINNYLNVSVLVMSSKNGLNIEQVTIGDISISGPWAIAMVKWGINTYVQQGLGDSLFEMIKGVDITEDKLLVHLSIEKNLLNKNNKDSIFVSLRDNLALFGNQAVIKLYYQELISITERTSARHSLAYYVRELFEFAQQRSVIFEQDNYINENRAALLALVIYFGMDKFELIVGDISTLDVKEKQLRKQLKRQTHLQGRVDLQQHFIYSIALQIFSSVNASDAIGEFKEFLDSNNGGSGFSFVDLMADRGGTRLAQLATRSQIDAKAVQYLLANITDSDLLPNIKGLPEGLSQQTFEQQFKHVKALEYQRLLKMIDEKLRELPLYRHL